MENYQLLFENEDKGLIIYRTCFSLLVYRDVIVLNPDKGLGTISGRCKCAECRLIKSSKNVGIYFNTKRAVGL